VSRETTATGSDPALVGGEQTVHSVSSRCGGPRPLLEGLAEPLTRRRSDRVIQQSRHPAENLNRRLAVKRDASQFQRIFNRLSETTSRPLQSSRPTDAFEPFSSLHEEERTLQRDVCRTCVSVSATEPFLRKKATCVGVVPMG